MENDKKYTARQEQLARFAKALGHPARISIMQFLAKQESCYFGESTKNSRLPKLLFLSILKN